MIFALLLITPIVLGAVPAAATHPGCFLAARGGSPTGVVDSSMVHLVAKFDQTASNCTPTVTCEIYLNGVALSNTCNFPGTCEPDPAGCHATIEADATVRDGLYYVSATLTIWDDTGTPISSTNNWAFVVASTQAGRTGFRVSGDLGAA